MQVVYNIETAHEYADNFINNNKTVKPREVGVLLIMNAFNLIHLDEYIYSEPNIWLNLYSRVRPSEQGTALINEYTDIANTIRDFKAKLLDADTAELYAGGIELISKMLNDKPDKKQLEFLAESLNGYRLRFDDIAENYDIEQALEALIAKYTRSHYLRGYLDDTSHLDKFIKLIDTYNTTLAKLNALTKSQTEPYKMAENPYMANINKLYREFQQIAPELALYSLDDIIAKLSNLIS